MEPWYLCSFITVVGFKIIIFYFTGNKNAVMSLIGTGNCSWSAKSSAFLKSQSGKVVTQWRQQGTKSGCESGRDALHHVSGSYFSASDFSVLISALQFLFQRFWFPRFLFQRFSSYFSASNFSASYFSASPVISALLISAVLISALQK